MESQHTIAIVGAGGIGRAAALILAELSEASPVIYLGDAYEQTAQSALHWVKTGTDKPVEVHAFTMPFEGINEAMTHAFEQADIVLDCLPGSQAPRIAQLARDHQMHYVNLTEYVKETNEVMAIAEGAETGFVLQTGLAPGFINILANSLYQQFTQQYNVEKVDYIGMKVGALTQNASAPHFYGFTWSTVGVATEYVKDAIAVRDHQKVMIPSLSEPETIIIDGRTYEVELTSGGAADLPDALADKVAVMDYKTIRYPGHYDWVKGILQKNNQLSKDEQINALQKEMETHIPRLEDDIVLIHSNVIGLDEFGDLRSLEKIYQIEPQLIGKHRLRAIQTTTAAPMCEAARMLLEGNYKGCVFQSQIEPSTFIHGNFVKAVYGK